MIQVTKVRLTFIHHRFQLTSNRWKKDKDNSIGKEKFCLSSCKTWRIWNGTKWNRWVFSWKWIDRSHRQLETEVRFSWVMPAMEIKTKKERIFLHLSMKAYIFKNKKTRLPWFQILSNLQIAQIKTDIFTKVQVKLLQIKKTCTISLIFKLAQTRNNKETELPNNQNQHLISNSNL